MFYKKWFDRLARFGLWRDFTLFGDRSLADSVHYRPDIDGLRAVAVLAVIGFHYFPRWVTGGFVGVDIFFVISGFLIANIILSDLDRDRFSFRDFYARRVRRIFPALLLVLAAVLAFGWWVFLSFEFEALGKHVLGGAAFMANILYWRESGYFDPAAITKPLLHLWSLGIEEQFYLLFPGLLYLSRKFKLRAVFVIGVLLALSFFYNYFVLYKQGQAAADFYSPLARFGELMIGAALAAAKRSGAVFQPKLRNKVDQALATISFEKPVKHKGGVCSTFISTFGLILISIAIFIFRERPVYPGHWALIPTLGTALVILAGPQGWFNRRLLSAKWLVAIGLISYPLYLWHWPLLSSLYIINGGMPNRLIRIIALAVSLVLAALTYKLVELPLRFGPQARGLKTGLLAASMVIMAGLGLYVKIGHGLPERPHIHHYERVAELLKLPDYAPGARSEECLAYAKDVPGYCIFKDAGSDYTVAVIGDSHAYVAYSGLAELNSTLGYNTVLLGTGGLLPFLGVADNHQVYNDKQINTIIDLLITKSDIRKIFIITLGSSYYTGLYASSGRKFPESLVVSRTKFEESLHKTVDKLSEAGKEVFVVMELPMVKADLRILMSNPFRRVALPPPLYKYEVVERLRDYKRILDNLEKATIIDPTDAFCPEEECLTFSPAGLPLYFDDNHLNALGSAFLAERVLKKYLVPSGPHSSLEICQPEIPRPRTWIPGNP